MSVREHVRALPLTVTEARRMRLPWMLMTIIINIWMDGLIDSIAAPRLCDQDDSVDLESPCGWMLNCLLQVFNECGQHFPIFPCLILRTDPYSRKLDWSKLKHLAISFRMIDVSASLEWVLLACHKISRVNERNWTLKRGGGGGLTGEHGRSEKPRNAQWMF